MASALMTGALLAGSLTAGAVAKSTLPETSAPPPATMGYAQGPGATRGGCFPMKQALGLSDKQDARLTEMRQAHFQEAAPLRQELFRLRGELKAESLAGKPDEKKIAGLAEEIGRQHAKLALLESRHLRQLSTVLDRKQMDQLMNLKGRHGFHKGPRW
jgi:Spy/CpxP family protein refolding chaperone